MTTDALDAIMTKLAGVAGALVSLKFINGTWPERIMMVVGGSLLSIYATPWATVRTSFPEGLCGFLLGLFGMTICSKVWDGIQLAPIAEFWNEVREFWKRKLGG